jgi:uncharacterized protein (TIGR02453 family)
MDHPPRGISARDNPSMTRFAGFDPQVRSWFEGLEADNSREYFAASREFFEAGVRDQLEALLTELSDQFGGDVKVFRQHRDVRFSPDKSPYKTNTYGIVSGSEIAPHGLYASISARGLVAGSGYHVMARDQLERYRARAADDARGSELVDLVAAACAAGLELWGEGLATAPRGYPRDHPRIELLRRLSLTLGATRATDAGIGRNEALTFVAGTWRASAPVTGWLDRNVGPSTIPVDRRRR